MPGTEKEAEMKVQASLALPCEARGSLPALVSPQYVDGKQVERAGVSL